MGKSSGTGQNGPRDTGSIPASRYVLTDKGEAAVEAIRAETATTPEAAARIAARARAGRREG